MQQVLGFLILIGSVALLMYGMKVMSEGLQKMAGSKLSNILGTMTTNRFTGLLTGTFITTSIQFHHDIHPVLDGYHRDDSQFRERWIVDTFASHQRHYGRQYRYDGNGMDHGAGLLRHEARCL